MRVIRLTSLAEELDEHFARRPLSAEELTPFDQLSDDLPPQTPKGRWQAPSPTSKWCPRCQLHLPMESWYRGASYCKDCQRTYQSQYEQQRRRIRVVR